MVCIWWVKRKVESHKCTPEIGSHSIVDLVRVGRKALGANSTFKCDKDSDCCFILWPGPADPLLLLVSCPARVRDLSFRLSRHHLAIFLFLLAQPIIGDRSLQTSRSLITVDRDTLC